MKRLLITGVVGAIALVVGIAIAIAANGGSGSASKNGAATVSVKRIGSAGKVLVDARGRALYSNDQEHGNKVLCVGPCVSFWMPLISAAPPRGRSLPGKLALAKRPGGAKQVTYNGKRLYTFTLDKPGRVTGDGFADSFGGQKFTWDVVHPTKVEDESSSGGSDGSGGYGGYGGY